MAEPASLARTSDRQPFRRLLHLFDRDAGPAHRLIPRWIFLRGLGLVYLSAFLALHFQILGLVGSGGVQPVGQLMAALHPLGQRGFLAAPSLLWWDSSDSALVHLVWVGLLASLLVVLNVLTRPCLIACWLCFLSFVTTAQDFSQYQSDGMLLEAGLLAILLAPGGVRPRWGGASLPSRAAYFLLLWEWFRIYFESGVVKLASGDPTWRHLTAMYEYYQNGPLPTWIGWYLQHLPPLFQRITAGTTLVMELVLVFLAFLPRRWRWVCFGIVTAWQVGVIATANYAFLNYLVLLLGFLLLDDRDLARFVPERWRSRLEADPERRTPSRLELARERARATEQGQRGLRRHPREVVRALRVALTAVGLTWIAYATTVPLLEMLVPRLPLPNGPVAALDPWRVANTYGLFANMTPHRYEVEFQGSNDTAHWTAYPFRYKPQDVRERPGIYAPYQPRFDWNLWFASLTDWGQAPIVPRIEVRLLEGSPQVLSLFARDPFAGHPPKYVRAVLWQYWFSTPSEKKAEGVWWRRTLLGTYAPTVTRGGDGDFVAVQLPTLNGPPQ